MDDYISRLAAIKYIKSKQCSKCSDIGLCGGCAVLIALKLLDEIPPADVRPVVRGRWQWRGFNIHCPFCDDEPFFDSTQELLNFCPNCGADMREEET